MDTLLNKPLPAMPEDVRVALAHPNITPTPLAEKNAILADPALQGEVGFCKTADGYLVSMVCPMPGITPEMIQWWFWWHPQDKRRYQVWYPGAHVGISYPRRDRAYYEQPVQPAFQPTANDPVERIGGMMMPLRIEFTHPEDFGFSHDAMAAHHIPLIVCGHVSAFGGLIPHTEMAHIFRQDADGLTLISRFWLGSRMKNPLLKKLVITESMARGMAEHCCIEYRNLVEILPQLYAEHH